jgi:hypothetical protein
LTDEIGYNFQSGFERGVTSTITLGNGVNNFPPKPVIDNEKKKT